MKDAITKLIDAAFGVQEFVEQYDRNGELVATALGDVLNERYEQINKHGFDAQHNDRNEPGKLALAGGAYAMNAACSLYPEFTDGSNSSRGQPNLLRSALYPNFQDGNDSPPAFWVWNKNHWKPKTAREDLVRAAALIIAEIERIDRAEARDA